VYFALREELRFKTLAAGRRIVEAPEQYSKLKNILTFGALGRQAGTAADLSARLPHELSSDTPSSIIMKDGGRMQSQQPHDFV